MFLSRSPLAKAAVRSKVVVLLLMISTPSVGSCYCSMLLCVTLFTYLLTYSLTYSLTGDRRQAKAILLLRGRLSSVQENQSGSRCSVGKYTVKPRQPGR